MRRASECECRGMMGLGEGVCLSWEKEPEQSWPLVLRSLQALRLRLGSKDQGPAIFDPCKKRRLLADPGLVCDGAGT